MYCRCCSWCGLFASCGHCSLRSNCIGLVAMVAIVTAYQKHNGPHLISIEGNVEGTKK